MTDPLKPHVLNNLANRAEHGIPHHVSLPAEMLMALIEEVRASRAPAMVPNEKIGRSRVVFVQDIADVEAPTVAELTVGTPVEGIEEVEVIPPTDLRYVYEITPRPDEDALWQQFHDHGGKIVNEHGEVIATVGPAVPSPDDPYGFVAPLTPPATELVRPMHVVYDDLGAGQPCSCHHDANHVRGTAPELTADIQGHRASWVEFDETHDFSKMSDEIRADVAKLAGITATPPILVEHEHDWRMPEQGRWECVSPGCDRVWTDDDV